MKILYETEATAIGGRSGSAASADGALRLRLATPEALGGSGGEGSNPEQLFAAGYAACFLSAMKDAAAQEQAVIADDANVTATVGLGVREDGPGLCWQVALGINLPGVDRATAERIIASAHEACPYSNAADPVLEQFKAADVIVIGSPMYNWTISSQLKAWIDRIAVAGETFAYTPQGPKRLVGGKRVIVITGRGSSMLDDRYAGFDHQEPYLRTLFRLLGIDDVTFVHAQGTALAADARLAVVAQAEAEIEQLFANRCLAA